MDSTTYTEKIQRMVVKNKRGYYWLSYLVLGLAEESGEAVAKTRKAIRLKSKLTEKEKESIALELGDVLWYLTQIAAYIDVPLEQIMDMNVEKVGKRRTQGNILRGNGDYR